MAAGKMIMSFFLVVLLLVGLMAMFTVKETELALMLRLGKVVSGDFAPGLHFKMPIFHQIRKFDKRIQTLDAPQEHFLTREKKNLIVDSFIKWRIVDVVTYFTSVSGNPQRAGRRLGEVIADGLRSEFGKRTIKEVVSGDRAEIMDIITAEASARAQKFGINIIDVRIKRIELPTEVSTSVYRRMEAERERDAKQLRSQGEAQAVRIRAGADRQSVEMIAKAERDAEKIRGEGDGEATNIYAQAYTQNTEFYALYRSLNAYKTTFSDRSDMLVIQPDSDFFKYFNGLSKMSQMTTAHAAQTVSKPLEVNVPNEAEAETTVQSTETTPELPKVNVPNETKAETALVQPAKTTAELPEVNVPNEVKPEVSTPKPVLQPEETASKLTEDNVPKGAKLEPASSLVQPEESTSKPKESKIQNEPEPAINEVN